MIKNYLKIAIRNLLKQKLFSFINVFSLTIGLTCTILIYLFIHDELSYDQFHQNKTSIYRVVQINNKPDGTLNYKGIFHSILLGPSMVEEIPGVEGYVRFYQDEHYVSHNHRTFKDQVLYGDLELFDIFSFPVTQGSIDKDNLKSVVLSEKASKKYFGNSDPIGKTLSFKMGESFIDFTVTAVCEEIPSSSSIKFEVLLPFRYLSELGKFREDATSWGFGAIITYIKLFDGTNPALLEDNLKKFILDHYPYYKSIAEEEGYPSPHDYRRYELQNLTDVHFDSRITSGITPSSNRLYSYILAAIVLGILGIGCINFMNLSIARSANRAKEIGLRKTVGAQRHQLLFQFLGESIILAAIAFVFSFLLVDVLLPVLSSITNRNFEIDVLFSWYSLMIMMAIILGTGIFSGVYPALVLSNIQIRHIFEKKIKLGGSNLFTRVLVICQFALSILLIVGMIVMVKQINFLKNKDLGFRGDQVLVLKNTTSNGKTVYGHLKKTLSFHTSIKSITTADQNFGVEEMGGRGFSYKGENMRVGIIQVGQDYLETFKMQLLAGRDFDMDLDSDNGEAVIVNEACLKDFRLSIDQPFEEFSYFGHEEPNVVGVIKNFNYASLRQFVDPLLIVATKKEDLNYVFVKVAPDRVNESLSLLQSKWAEVVPNLPFEYEFLDHTMKAQYALEDQWIKVVNYAMVIAILLSCLGLFGLVALAVVNKRNEIGIRKVLGAKINQIVWLFLHKFANLIFIAFILTIPVSYYLLESWLDNFAYKIEIGISIYVISGFIIMLVSMLTIGFKVVRAAMENPVRALRNE
ncbi:ABC transporter permease [Fulvivirgaceae bacterium BMA10]|uniref:ABC transporter permease n=1 Tax=Splendidivirga corallicola TaxID=3051826 RepID=A0ABT8KQH6_9BACT|nr:ABC transporter permease [Fulvivirgaceae bacterium BMA10]